MRVLIGFSSVSLEPPRMVAWNTRKLVQRLAPLNPSQATSRSGFFIGGQPRICRGLTGRDTGNLQLWASPERQRGRRRKHPRTQGFRVCATVTECVLKANLVKSWAG